MPDFRLAIVPVTVYQQNCTLLWNSETMAGLVIDPGGEPGRILQTINDQALAVEAILLTHGHLDHAGGALALKGLLDAQAAREGRPSVPVIGPHEADRFLLDGIEETARGAGFQGLRNITPDRFLGEGDSLDLIGLRLDVFHCPGHTPGHIVFVARERRFALVGDVLFRGSIGRTDFPYGDHDALITAIKTKLLPLGDDIGFICGHGPGSTFGAERQTNPFLQG